jgi:4-hydroxybenzoyl-CoA reductase subunit beta
MSLPEFAHLEPGTLLEACSLLKKYEGQAMVIAGGTDLLNLMRDRLFEPGFLIDLKGIPGLREMRDDESKGLVIGSGVTLSRLMRSPLVREKARLLADAAATVGAPPLQNMGTLGGNICLNTRCFYYNQSKSWRSSRPACLKAGGEVCHVVKAGRRCYSAFQADAACVLVALNAEIRLASEGGERRLSLSEFYTGKGENPNGLRPSEILTEVTIPPDRWAATYEKLAPRASLDFPQIGVAAVLRFALDRTVEDAKVVLNAVSPAPVEITEARELLVGKKVDEDLIGKVSLAAQGAAHPVDNTGVPPSYRKKMVCVLVSRALRKLSAQNPSFVH